MRTTHVLSTIAVAVSLAVGALAGTSVLAQDARTDARVEANARLSIAQVYERMTALGYKDIDEIERDGGVYEIEARTSAGERVKLHVDARSGEILRTKSEARDEDRENRRMGKEADRRTRDGTDRPRRDGHRVQTLSSETMET